MPTSISLLLISVGVIAGWLYGSMTRARPYGLLVDLAGGAAGSVVGGLLFERSGIPTSSLFWSLISALIGAALVQLLLRAVRRFTRAPR